MQLNKLFRTPKNQVSTPRPECGVGFDSSARAMNRSASKGSLMVHEYSHTTPAVKGILSFATFSERKHMLKTLKRKIALVAVAAVGVGMLSAIPANAEPGFDKDERGIELVALRDGTDRHFAQEAVVIFFDGRGPG